MVVHKRAEVLLAGHFFSLDVHLAGDQRLEAHRVGLTHYCFVERPRGRRGDFYLGLLGALLVLLHCRLLGRGNLLGLRRLLFLVGPGPAASLLASTRARSSSVILAPTPRLLLLLLASSLPLSLFLLLLLSLLLIDLRQQFEDSQQKLTLFRGQIFSHLVKCLLGSGSALRPQVAAQLNLVDAFHLVRVTQLFPLELVDVQLVLRLEQLFTRVEATFLSSFQSLEGDETRADKERLANIDSAVSTRAAFVRVLVAFHKFKALHLSEFAEVGL